MFTRRGYLAVAVLLGALAMSWQFGARALNAVAAPVLVALLAAVVQLWRMDPPRVRRDAPENGFVDETHAVRLALESDRAFEATVVDAVDEGLVAEGNAVETTVSETELTYHVTLARRGEHRFGPVRVVARDVLGLWEREFTRSITDRTVVFPQVHELRGVARQNLDRIYHGANPGRSEFDQLREYVHGDPLQDVHWKTSAKRPEGELLVKQYETPREEQEVTVAAEADEGRVDAMAEAAASVVAYLLSSGFAVRLVTPSGSVPHGAGEDHRRKLLTVLARTDAGRVGPKTKERANVVLAATGDVDDVLVTIGNKESRFATLAGGASGGQLARADGGERR